MISISDTARQILQDQGRTQKWVVNKMNEINPKLGMDRSKLSAIITGNRKMTGDELLVFCIALEVNPDVFTEKVEDFADQEEPKMEKEETRV